MASLANAGAACLHDEPKLDHGVAPSALPRVEILGVPISLVDRKELIMKVDDLLSGGKKGWISYVNIHSLNLAFAAPTLKRYFRNSLLNYCDGAGVQLGARILGRKIPEKLTLPDFFEDLCSLAEKKRYRFFFLGSSSESLASAIRAIRTLYPNLDIGGSHHGYFDRSNGIDIVRLINKVKPHILFVGMDMPVQEEWVQRNLPMLEVNVVWTGGGIFELLSGNRKRAPRWMSQNGLEWLYRLLQEPGRLWKRYLVGNPLFLYRIARQRMNRSIPE